MEDSSSYMLYAWISNYKKNKSYKNLVKRTVSENSDSWAVFVVFMKKKLMHEWLKHLGDKGHQYRSGEINTAEQTLALKKMQKHTGVLLRDF